MCLRAIFSLIPLTAFLAALKSITFCKNSSFTAAFKKQLLPSTQELQFFSGRSRFPCGTTQQLPSECNKYASKHV